MSFFARFGGRWQQFVSTAFLVVMVLMATQYAVVKYGRAKVLVGVPWHYNGASQIAEEVPDQAPGVYLLDWQEHDKAAYKLDDGTYLPPAEGCVALLFLAALPLLALTPWRRQVWPRWPVCLLVGLTALSLLNADHFKPGLRETAQVVLTFLVTYWLAAAAVRDEEQATYLGQWLAGLTVVLLVIAGIDYYRFMLAPGPGHELPMAVRATCASRSAYGGLMVMLLALGYGRVLASGNVVVSVIWAVLCAAGVASLLSAGAVLALVVAAIAMGFAKSSKAGLISLVAVPVVVGLVCHQASPNQGALLRQSIGFYKRAADASHTPYAVEKRYLEMMASFNALRACRDVVPPADAAGGQESVAVVGERDNAVLGVGPGLNYQKSIGRYYLALDNPEKQEQDTYNLYLLLAVQVGLFGAFAWAWLLLDGAAVARRAYVSGRQRRLKALALGIYGACVGVLVFSVFGTVLVRGTGLLLVTLLAVAARLEELLRPRPAAAPEPAARSAQPDRQVTTAPSGEEPPTEPVAERPDVEAPAVEPAATSSTETAEAGEEEEPGIADMDDGAWQALLAGTAGEANPTDEESSKGQDDEDEGDEGE